MRLHAGTRLSFFIVTLAACATGEADHSDGGTPPRGGADSVDADVVSPDGAAVGPDGSSTRGDSGSEAAAACNSGTIAVLAGNDGMLGGAVQERGGVWASAPIAGAAAKSKPALVAFGTGFLGVTHGMGDALQSTTFGASWSTPSTIGTAGVKGAPALAVEGTRAHLVYAAGASTKKDFTHGIHDGASWNAATDAVGPPPSFGTVSAGLSAAGTEVVFVENGSDQKLYARTFTTGWSPSSLVAGAATLGSSSPATPEIVPVEGTFDMLLLYVEKTSHRLSFATRRATSKAWENGGNVDAFATTDEKLSLSRAGQFTVLVAFRGQDGNGYYVQGTIGVAAVTWTAAHPIGGGGAFAVDSTPAVARGVCGDDAVVAHASGGVVSVTRLRGNSWTPAESIGLTGTRVALATK